MINYWSQILNHPYRILIIEGYGSGKTKALADLIKQQDDDDYIVKKIDMLDDTPNQLCKFRTKNCVEIKGDSRGTDTTNSQNRFKSSMVKSSLCDYSDAYMDVQRTITVPK